MGFKSRLQSWRLSQLPGHYPMYHCQVLSTLLVHQLHLGELVFYHGNTLGDPAAWSTYCHYSRADLPMQVAPADLLEVKTVVAASIGGEQMALF